MSKLRRKLAGLLMLVVGVSAPALILVVSASAAPVCTKSWTTAADGSWTDPSRWTPIGTPTAASDVCITVPGAYAVTLAAEGGTINSLQLGATSGADAAELRIAANSPGSNAGLTIATTADVGPLGILTLTQTGGTEGRTMTLNGASGTSLLTNAGTVRTLAGQGGVRNIGISISNAAGGTVDIDHATNFNLGGRTFTNSGGNVVLSQALTVSGGANFANNSGGIDGSGAGQVRQVNSGTFTQGGGTTTNNPVEIFNANLAMTGTGASSFVFRGNLSTLSGASVAGQTMEIHAVTGPGNAFVNLTSPFTNGGIIRFTNTELTSQINAVASNTLTNTGTIESPTAANGARNLQVNLTNAAGGVVDIDYPTNFNLGGRTFTNSGGNVVLSQPLDVSGGANFNNASGDIDGTGPGQVRQVGSGTFTQGGGTTTNNPVLISNANLAMTGSGASSFVFRGALNTLSGSSVAGQNLELHAVTGPGNATVNLTSPFTNGGVIRFTNSELTSSSATATHRRTRSRTPAPSNLRLPRMARAISRSI